MAWYPEAIKLELQPESDDQPAIRPTQLIMHSIAAPWDEQRLFAFWKTTNLESHFGLDYDGSLGQFVGTETRADANARANLRPDGTGAVSVETASNTDSSDSWTAGQIEGLLRLGVWMHRRHGVPLRICRTHDDDGFGYHSMFPEWSTSGTDCPGKARIEQFRRVVFPGIVARATQAPQEDGMDLTDEQYARIGRAAWAHRTDDPLKAGTETVTVEQSLLGIAARVDRIEQTVSKPVQVQLVQEQVRAIGVAVASNPALAEQIAKLVTANLANRMAE